MGPWVTWVGPGSLEAKSRAEAALPAQALGVTRGWAAGWRRCARLQGLCAGLG